MAIITVDDLPSALQAAELAETWVNGANANALRVAPCLAEDAEPPPSQGLLDEAKLILVGAVKRWAEASSGGITTQQAGPFAMTADTRHRTGYRFWPSEIGDLTALCKDASTTRAFQVDTTPPDLSPAVPDWWCL